MAYKLPPFLQGITTTASDDGLHLHATRHPVPLDERPFGLPVTGALELDVDLLIAGSPERPDPVHSRGSLAVRSTARGRVGDDATPIRHPRLDAFFPGGIPFTHLDIDSLDVALTVADGVARLTRFDFASPDLQLELELAVTLVEHFLASTLDGVVRFRLADAFTAREPLLSAGLSLFNLSRDPTGLATLPFTGTVANPRIAPVRR